MTLCSLGLLLQQSDNRYFFNLFRCTDSARLIDLRFAVEVPVGRRRPIAYEATDRSREGSRFGLNIHLIVQQVHDFEFS